MKKVLSMLIVMMLSLVVFSTCVQAESNASEFPEPEEIRTAIIDGIQTIIVEGREILFSGDEFSEFLTPGLDYLILVNHNHPYEFGGEYDQILQQHMTTFADVVDGDYIKLESGAWTAFTALQHYLDTEFGMQVGIYDAYRTEELQEYYYSTYCRAFWGDLKEDPAYDAYREFQAGNPLAAPGESETHTGLLFNIHIKYQGPEDEKPIWYAETAERQDIEYFKILHEHLADFGFIDRFPAGKEEWTGVFCEPYQIRFVGSSRIAHEIMDNGLCLEEYLGETQKIDPNRIPDIETIEKYIP